MNILHSIFHNIYCSDYFRLSTVVLVGTIFVAVINSFFKNKKWYKYLCLAGIIAFATVILAGTIFSRSSDIRGYTLNLIPFASLKIAIQGNEEGFRVCYMNSLLFYPLGCLFFGYNNKRFKTIYYIIAGLLLSVIIEVLQFVLHLGVAEIDDIIFNTLGVILGYFFCTFFDDVVETSKNLLK